MTITVILLLFKIMILDFIIIKKRENNHLKCDNFKIALKNRDTQALIKSILPENRKFNYTVINDLDKIIIKL